MVDNIPVGSFANIAGSEDKVFSRGFPVGFVTTSGKNGAVRVHNLNNHLRIIVKYHDDEDGLGDEVGEPTSKIVGFRVEPMSIKHSYAGETFTPGQSTLSTCSPSNPASNDPRNYHSVDRAADNDVVFTYDVAWEKSSVEWSERWDVYLNSGSPNEKVHWFSITNSIMIVLFLTVMIAVILLRALHKVRYYLVDHISARSFSIDFTALTSTLFSSSRFPHGDSHACRTSPSTTTPRTWRRPRRSPAGSWCTATSSARPPPTPCSSGAPLILSCRSLLQFSYDLASLCAVCSWAPVCSCAAWVLPP